MSREQLRITYSKAYEKRLQFIKTTSDEAGRISQVSKNSIDLLHAVLSLVRGHPGMRLILMDENNAEFPLPLPWLGEYIESAAKKNGE